MKARGWTEAEVETLRSYYPTFATFHDLLDKLPGRSPNSIRLMASRLGLKRPTLLPGIERVNSLQLSRQGSEGSVLVKCSCCGERFGIPLEKAHSHSIVTCGHCGGFSFLSD